MEYNSVKEQKHIWSNCIKHHQGEKLYGYEWGDPLENQTKNVHGMVLGNYLHIKDNYILPNIVGKHFMDIGSLGGKWLPFLKDAAKITCVDITDAGFEYIEKTIPVENRPAGGIHYYLTRGDELEGISSGSVDFIFSIDSLVRTEKDIYPKYLADFRRVLTDNGKVCVHLPCMEVKLSYELGFTPFTFREIHKMVRNAGFEDNFRLDTENINHGILLLVNL